MPLCACTTAPSSPAPVLLPTLCPSVTRCTLPAMAPRTNGELSEALIATRAAWARCAAQVDMIAACQARLRAEQHTQPEAEPLRSTHE
ncbi:Rz1-like lysis system protein LysC [Burkholderia sp. Nafp2/4-1b]|uniref:Rz1-like lysis system protein LysC n=1 Tax=Burkholderia sp. Nafp2/4-1b TaxID=2116686 RepID=UPI001F09198C|nr:Rz1-like lysis system protein LysC [Burkholderia sp. Nafp2/4-1b]